MNPPLTRQQEWRRRYPRRYAAHCYVRLGIRLGFIAPVPCEVCGAKAEAHHPDYDRPGDVVWLCRKHHRQAHAREGQA